MALSGEHHFKSQGKNEPLDHEWYVLASTSTESLSSTWKISFSLSDYHLPDVIFDLYGRHFSRQSCQGRQLPTDRGRGTRVLLQCSWCWGRGTRAVVGQDVLPCRGKNYSCTNVIDTCTNEVRTETSDNESWNSPCFLCWATLAPNLHAFFPRYENCCGLQLATTSLEIVFRRTECRRTICIKSSGTWQSISSDTHSHRLRFIKSFSPGDHGGIWHIVIGGTTCIPDQTIWTPSGNMPA